MIKNAVPTIFANNFKSNIQSEQVPISKNVDVSEHTSDCQSSDIPTILIQEENQVSKLNITLISNFYTEYFYKFSFHYLIDSNVVLLPIIAKTG